jgi:hypothetical protein
VANFQQKQPSSRAGNVQRIPYTASAASSAPFSSETYQVRFSSYGPCNVLVFSSTDTVSVANSNNGFYLGANIVDYHTVTPGQALSVVKTPSDGSITSVNGTLWVVEMS